MYWCCCSMSVCDVLVQMTTRLCLSIVLLCTLCVILLDVITATVNGQLFAHHSSYRAPLNKYLDRINRRARTVLTAVSGRYQGCRWDPEGLRVLTAMRYVEGVSRSMSRPNPIKCRLLSFNTVSRRRLYRLSGTGIAECLEVIDVWCNLKHFDVLT